jgi:transcriptional regulator GlxA family with amidase domain
VLAARSLDLRIPVDVAVLAAEDTRMICENTWPGISGVDLGLKRLGTRLAGLLQRRLEGETSDVHVQLDPAGVVARPSTEFAAADDDVLAAALAYLHETPLDEACLEEMYRRVPASARTIQRRFAQRLGCSPADHLQRMRLGQAQHLLRATSLPLVDIAVRCGYEFVSNFCRSFKSATGRTPTQYRRGLDPGAE